MSLNPESSSIFESQGLICSHPLLPLSLLLLLIIIIIIIVPNLDWSKKKMTNTFHLIWNFQ